VRCSNLTLWIGLAAAWIVPAFAYGLAASLEPLRNAQLLFSFFTAFLFYLLLIETHVVYSPAVNRLDLLLGFILLVYLLLPLFLDPVFALRGFYVYSPLGFWADLFDGDGQRVVSHYVWVVNLGLGAIPANLIADRYRMLRTAREQM